MSLRVLFFTDGPESPGSRFRCLQFFPHLRARGIECDVRFAYDERYNDVFAKPWAAAYKLAGRLRRVAHMVADGGADLLFLHKTALAVTGLPEWARSLRRTPIVFDFDDAIYLGPGGAPSLFRRRAFEHAVAAADRVIAGNSHLAEMTSAPEKTTVIPSVADTAKYVPSRTHGGGELVVGWIGTASNFPSLRPIIPQVLEALGQLPRARLRIVSNGVLPEYARHPLVEQWRWHEDRERAALQSFDVGLMPLVDNELTRGKCGFKMIQYMATGVPVISSAVGANVDIFENSQAGFLVGPEGDWRRPVVELGRSPELRAKLGAAGREHAVHHYSVASVIDRYVEVLEACAAGPGARRRG
ncbi:MAG: glycosyltransferase [Deltaproteobacteria bacterium]|nr:glycosyltransferase [Deltaproteobacteria bacterium]